MSVKNKKRPDRNNAFCQGRITLYPRCHLASRHVAKCSESRSFSGYDKAYPRPLTRALRCRILSTESAFDCTLRGPFAKQCLTRFAASRALCVVLNGFISASTVYDESSISLPAAFVNMFFEKAGKESGQSHFLKNIPVIKIRNYEYIA